MVRSEISNLHGLRALAILPVLALHASYGRIQGGFLGVDLFFVLSGFLITWLLYEELQKASTINFRNFYIRRALRLLPAGFASLALAAVLWPITMTEDSDLLLAAGSVIFYFSNLVDNKILGTLSPAWSLSIEEQFYLIWPITLFGLFRLFGGRRQPIIACLCGVILLVGASRATIFYHWPFTYDLYRFTFFRIDGLLAGAIVAIALTGSATLNKSVSLVIVTIAPVLFGLAVIFVGWWQPVLYYGGFTLIAVMAAVLVFALTQLSPHWLFSNPVMIWIGKRSYGLYIYHMPIFHSLNNIYLADNPKLNFAIITLLRLALTFLVAELSYRYLEKRFLAKKKDFETQPVVEVLPPLKISKAPPVPLQS